MDIFLKTILLLLLFIPQQSFAQECFSNSNTDDREELKRLLEDCQEQIEVDEAQLMERARERTTTEYDLLLIDVEINKSLLRIRSSDVEIDGIEKEVDKREATVETLANQLFIKQNVLSELLKRINEDEQKGFLNIVLSDISLSSFFSKSDDYDSLRENVSDSIREVAVLKTRLEEGVIGLEGKLEERARTRNQQVAFKSQVESQRGLKQTVLDKQLSVEQKIQEGIDTKQFRAAEIQNRLFELSGGGAIPFHEAVEYARQAEKIYGIRPAFLLGLIKHESDLGKNVGTGSWRTDMHPTRDAPVFPYITKLLGLDPDEVRVSANPGFGWGGAMGPAQFIPSTWVCYGGLINKKTGTCNKNVNLIKSTDTLSIGSTGADVKRLQEFLNDNGFTIARSGPGSRGEETSYYGANVASAVTRFQEKYAVRILRQYGYTKGTGQVGPATRNAVNELNFYEGPWEYSKKDDRIRTVKKGNSPSNPWNPLDALLTSATYLTDLGAVRDECTAARKYYAGGNWRTQVASNYCRAVLSNATLFERDIEFIQS